MGNLIRLNRRIALFVEGDSERGNARQKSLPAFFHKWLDPKLPPNGKIGIDAKKFTGVAEYLKNVGSMVELYITRKNANMVFGLVDLYGLQELMDFSKCESVKDKIATARKEILSGIPEALRPRFRQHFAVHEIEAWLLAYPEEFPRQIRKFIQRRKNPEEVNFDDPPVTLLKGLFRQHLKRDYDKFMTAVRIFPEVDPQTAIDLCPNLKLMAEDLLDIALKLQ